MAVCLCGCVESNRDFFVNCQDPVILEELLVHRDGGSLSFVFLCGDNNRLSFRLDGGARSSTRWHFYLDTDDVSKNNRMLLSLGGVEEERLLNVMESWLESNFSNEELERIVKSTDFRDTRQKEFRARRIKNLIDSRPRFIKDIKEREGDLN
jgi:hypothetical protein